MSRILRTDLTWISTVVRSDEESRNQFPGSSCLRWPRAKRQGAVVVALAALIVPGVCPAAEVIVYPWDYGWFTYLPIWGLVGVTNSNPRAGFGSLELMKPVGGGGAYINWTIADQHGTWGTLSVLGFDSYTDRESSALYGPDVAIRIYPYGDTRSFFLIWNRSSLSIQPGVWRHDNMIGHMSIQAADGNTPPGSLGAIPADSPISEIHIRSNFAGGGRWRGFVDNVEIGFAGHESTVFNFEAVPDPPPVPGDVVISQFRVRGPMGVSDEFIELYNRSGTTVALGGWRIIGPNWRGDGHTVDLAVIPAGTILRPGCHYLITNRSTPGGPYSGSVPGDLTMDFTDLSDTGGFALARADGSIADRVGLDPGATFKEGTPLANLGFFYIDKAYERKPGGSDGNGQDTDDNSADFVIIEHSNPRNSSSGCVDVDSDGVDQQLDNCPGVGNPDQTDADSDGLGDACDNCPNLGSPNGSDADSDGRGDACDNCPYQANADQADRDSDGIGDACDNCPDLATPDTSDWDGDGVGNACDNCLYTYNPTQPDADSDGSGDSCDYCPSDPLKQYPGYCGCGVPDTDSDGDGWPDCADYCPHDAANDADYDGLCGDVDPCPSSDRSWLIVIGGCDSGVVNQMLASGCTMVDEIAKARLAAHNHGQFVSAVAHLANDWRAAGLLSDNDKGRIESCAAHAPPLASFFSVPYDAVLFVAPMGGGAGATSDFGLGTSQADAVPILHGLPNYPNPSGEVHVGNVARGSPLHFYQRTEFGGVYWAFSIDTITDASRYAFIDLDDSLGFGGSIIEQTGPTTWLLHMDDAASFYYDDDDDDVLVQLRLEPAGGIQVPTVRGDLDCNGVRDGLDIAPFVQVLLNPAGFMNDNPGCPIVNADFDGDSLVTPEDVPGMVNCLLGGDCP